MISYTKMQRVVILALVLIATAVGLCEGLRVGAFNIQVFGKTKFGNQEVVKLLSQVRCCDVLVISEYMFHLSSDCYSCILCQSINFHRKR